MAASLRIRTPRCGIDGCRSRRYHVESGLTYCSQGHHQEGFIHAAQDFEDINISASQSTRIRDSQKKSELAAHVSSLAGPQGLQLFLAAFQLVLRKQVQAFEMITGQRPLSPGRPTMFEEIVNELWGIRLQVLGDAGLEAKGDSGKRKSQKESSSGENKSPSDVRPPRTTPQLLETIGLLYLGAVCLRIPLPLSKLQQWVQDEDLYWIRAAKVIPEEMRDTLAAGYQTVFLPHGSLRDGKLHSCVAELVVSFQDRFPTFKLPALNHQPILLDYLVRLALPFPLYSGVENLAKLMNLDFCTSSLKHLRSGWLVHELPEMQVVALIVVAAKHYYPFDNKQYYSRGRSDLSILSLDWEKWESFHMASEQTHQESRAEKLDRAHQVKVEPNDVFQMKPEEMDAYMDWYQEQWANMDIQTPQTTEQGEIRDKHTQHKLKVFGSFPPHKKSTAPADAGIREEREQERLGSLLKDVHASLSLRDVVSERREAKATEPVPRMGTDYVQYRKVEQLEQHKWAKEFHMRVSRTAGVPLETLLAAVVALDDKIAATKREHS